METVTESKFRKWLSAEVVGVIAIISVAFSVSSFFLKPTFSNSKEIEDLKAQLSSHQELSEQISNLKDNHIHTIEVKVDQNAEAIGKLQNEMVKIETILDERLPKKK